MARWVREAEKARDAAGASGGELQEEVYRRRKVLYSVREVPRHTGARPEMILVFHDPQTDSYECRIFYKEPRPALEPENLTIPADRDSILRLRSHRDPGIRLAAMKVGEFHDSRLSNESGGNAQPLRRRVFYANEL